MKEINNLVSGHEFYMGADCSNDLEEYQSRFIEILARGVQGSSFVREHLREILDKSNPRRGELIAEFKWHHDIEKRRKLMMR